MSARSRDATVRAGRADRTRALSWLASAEVGLFFVTAAFAAFFWLATPGFGSTFNLYALTRVLAIDAVIGFSMMVVLVTGGLNLAVGAIGVGAAMVAGWGMQGLGLPWPVAAVGALLAGGLLGAVNGAMTIALRVHSFVVTLATMSIFFGGMILLTEANPYNALPAGFVGIAKMRYGALSALLLLALAAGVALWWLFRHTILGRQILAAGAASARPGSQACRSRARSSSAMRSQGCSRRSRA